LVLYDWVCTGTFLALEKIIVLLIDMWHNNHSIVVNFDLHLASSINSFFGIFVTGETNESRSWLLSKFVRGDRTELREEGLQILHGESLFWEILHIQVGVSVTLVLSVILLGMNHDLDILLANLGIM